MLKYTRSTVSGLIFDFVAIGINLGSTITPDNQASLGGLSEFLMRTPRLSAVHMDQILFSDTLVSQGLQSCVTLTNCSLVGMW